MPTPHTKGKKGRQDEGRLNGVRCGVRSSKQSCQEAAGDMGEKSWGWGCRLRVCMGESSPERQKLELRRTREREVKKGGIILAYSKTPKARLRAKCPHFPLSQPRKALNTTITILCWRPTRCEEVRWNGEGCTLRFSENLQLVIDISLRYGFIIPFKQETTKQSARVLADTNKKEVKGYLGQTYVSH